MSQPSLPGMPEPVEIGPTPPGWVIAKIHTERLCSRCQYDILARGIDVAPPPARAMYRVGSRKSLVEHLCARHLVEKMETNS